MREPVARPSLAGGLLEKDKRNEKSLPCAPGTAEKPALEEPRLRSQSPSVFTAASVGGNFHAYQVVSGSICAADTVVDHLRCAYLAS